MPGACMPGACIPGAGAKRGADCPGGTRGAVEGNPAPGYGAGDGTEAGGCSPGLVGMGVPGDKADGGWVGRPGPVWAGFIDPGKLGEGARGAWRGDAPMLPGSIGAAGAGIGCPMPGIGAAGAGIGCPTPGIGATGAGVGCPRPGVGAIGAGACCPRLRDVSPRVRPSMKSPTRG